MLYCFEVHSSCFFCQCGITRFLFITLSAFAQTEEKKKDPPPFFLYMSFVMRLNLLAGQKKRSNTVTVCNSAVKKGSVVGLDVTQTVGGLCVMSEGECAPFSRPSPSTYE